ncbi:MAG: GntR family transcriptional regulator [Anaerolineae bacterium]|nr:GntR family transcriptional regulator [Anaerolineae bacterium]
MARNENLNSEHRLDVKRNLTDLTYQQIKQRILNGEYAPAQRLIETSLAEDLGVGRHNVRTALDRLQADGLVQIEPNRGATVKSFELSEVLDILMAREALEAEVTYLAAGRIEAAQIQHLAECLDIMRDALRQGDYDRYSAINKAFHQIIYAASGNQTMPELIVLLRQRLARLQIRTILVPGRTEQSLAEHEAIYQALQAHDASAAKDAARAHLKSLRVNIQKAWQLIQP